MKTEAGGERLEFLRAARQFGEDADFDGAEEGFRGPESDARLQDVVGREVGWAVMGCSVSLKQRR